MIRLGCWLTMVLPVRLQLGMADVVGELGWRLLPAMHRRVRENVRHILGPEACNRRVEAVARHEWRNYIRYLRDFVALPHLSREQVRTVFQQVEGWEHVEDAMARGRGAVIVSAHFGNWDLAAAIMALHYPLNVIVDSFSPPKLDRLINRARTSIGVRIIPVASSMRRTLSALRRNEAVAFLVDKPIPGQGVTVNFFGRPSEIPGGAAFFALKARAPIVPAFVWRNADGKYAARVLPPFECEATGDLQHDMRAAMQRVMLAVEEMVRSRPEHWYMFRRMWPRQEAAVA
ncbi:MAG: lysophospholipid acyltransferase family protein [Chloroflexota bacterium]